MEQEEKKSEGSCGATSNHVYFIKAYEFHFLSRHISNTDQRKFFQVREAAYWPGAFHDFPLPQVEGNSIVF